MNATSIRAAAVLALVFVLGAVSGVGAAYAWVRHRDAATMDDDHHGYRDPRRLRALERALDLTDAQRDRVRDILQRSAGQRRDLAQHMYEQCGSDLRRHHDAVAAEIRAVLDPAQQQRFDEIGARQQQRFPFGGPRGF